MKKLTYVLLFVTSTLGAQEVRAPQRGEERREPRVERPEPVRVQPQPENPRQEQPPRQVQPRPEPPISRPNSPMGRPGGVVILDPWVHNRGDCWNRMDCGINPWIMMQMDFNRRQRMERNRRPSRIEMAPVRGEFWNSLTEKQRKQILEARKDFREKVQKIIKNP